MSEEIKDEGWAISLGFYPGILIGARSYYAERHDVSCAIHAVF
jgi:hypothetical protein